MKKNVFSDSGLNMAGIFAIAVGFVFLTGCGNDQQNEETIDIQLTRSESDAVNAVNDFAFDLLKVTEEKFATEKHNYVLSPQNVAWCISMVANGADAGSETLKEMIEVLHLGDETALQDVNDYSLKLINAITSKNGSADVRVANALYYKSSIQVKPDFINTLKTFYTAEEFSDPTNGSLDSWISGRTGGLINDFAQKNNIEINFYGVINAMFFKGVWETPFDQNNTKERDFRNDDGSVSSVQMMENKVSCRWNDLDICHFLKLFFNKKSFAINFVIPSEGNSCEDVIEYLDGDRWRQMSDNTHADCCSVRIPRLNLKSDFSFVEVVKSLGMKKVFSEDAELSKICQSSYPMQSLDQASLFNLDEQGVKAATTGHIGSGPTSAIGGEYFYLDEPFIFFITEESTGAILFAGKVSRL